MKPERGMITLPPVANDGAYGDIIKRVLRQEGLSYTDLAELLDRRGVKVPGTNGRVEKSRIGNYATNRNMTPDWFMRAMGIVLYNDPQWWENFSAEVVRGSRLARSRRAIPLIGSPSGETLEVTGLVAAGEVAAVRIVNHLARPSFTARDLLIIDTTGVPTNDESVYVIEEPEGQGRGSGLAERLNVRLATFDNDQATLVFRSVGRRLPDIPAAEATVFGMLIQVYEDWDLNTLPRGRFDLSGQMFGENW